MLPKILLVLVGFCAKYFHYFLIAFVAALIFLIAKLAHAYMLEVPDNFQTVCEAEGSCHFITQKAIDNLKAEFQKQDEEIKRLKALIGSRTTCL